MSRGRGYRVLGSRHTGGPRATIGKLVSFVSAWWLPIVAGLAVFRLSSWTGSVVAAAVIVAAVLAVWVVGYWQWRVRKADHHLPFLDVATQLWRAWFVRKEWVKACDAVNLGNSRRVSAPPLRNLTLEDDGTIRAVVYHGKYGIETSDLIGKRPGLRDCTGCEDLAIRSLRGEAYVGRGSVLRNALSRKAGRCEVSFYYDDPAARMVRLSELPLSPAGTIAYGRRLDGSSAFIDAYLSTLIFGATGSGKSNVAWTLLASVIRAGIPVELYVSDPKSGLELGALGRQVGQGSDMFRVARYVTDEEGTLKVAEEMVSTMHRRMAAMAARRQRKHTFTPAEPLMVLLCDEFLTLPQIIKDGIKSPVGKIAFTGRAAGVVVWGLAQDPTKEATGAIRDLVPNRIALRLNSPSSNVPALGVAAPCHEIRKAGAGYSYRENDPAPVMFKAPLVRDVDTERIAQGLLPASMFVSEVENDPQVLYRYWGVLPSDEYPDLGGEEVLLYLGRTNDWLRRDAEHRDEDDWYRYVTRDSHDEVWPSVTTVLAAERAAIDAEKPVFNSQHNTGNPVRKSSRRRRLQRVS